MKTRSILLLVILSFFSCNKECSVSGTNQRIIFFGDSITFLGVNPGGYVSIIKDTMTKKHPSIEIIGAGIGGNKVPDLLDRINADVIKKNPTVVVVYIGINDVWHFAAPGLTGTEKDVYEDGLEEIIGRMQKNGAKVILCTPSVIGEKKNGANEMDAMLDEYSAISRRVAKKMNAPLCDLRAVFVDYLKIHNTDNAELGVLTKDRVHLNDNGNRLVAIELLKTLNQVL